MEWKLAETAPIGTLEEPERFLVWVADGGESGKGGIAFGYRSKNGVRAEGYMGNWNISHWMPLPKPPTLVKLKRVKS